MTERYTSERAVFATDGGQKEFLFAVRNTLSNSWGDLAKTLKRHPRTVRDWAREKYRMPYSDLIILAQKAQIKFPEDVQIRTWKEHATKVGRRGGKALVKKHGGRVIEDEKHRLKKWRQWWEKTGKQQVHPIINKPLPIQKPDKSELLAEFVGIILGDGGISPSQVVVTLHRFNDGEFSQHVRKLITKLFGVIPSTHKLRDALADNIVVSRVELVRFCVNELGLKLGNKIRQRVDIPPWVKKNEKFLKACVRGLIDTDGSVFNHRYSVNGKQYSYKKIAFTTASEPLRQSIFEALSNLGLHPRLAGTRDVRLDRREDLRKYFILVGSNNPKHLKRYSQ